MGDNRPAVPSSLLGEPASPSEVYVWAVVGSGESLPWLVCGASSVESE